LFQEVAPLEFQTTQAQENGGGVGMSKWIFMFGSEVPRFEGAPQVGPGSLERMGTHERACLMPLGNVFKYKYLQTTGPSQENPGYQCEVPAGSIRSNEPKAGLGKQPKLLNIND
jgi:hypothetical protein